MELASTDVVLDANVLIPAVLRDMLLRASAAGLYRVHWSTETIDEVYRNLVRRRMTDELGARRLVDTLRSVFPDAEAQVDESIALALTNNPKDRHVLAAAIAVGATVIVTANLRHFPISAVAPHGVEAISPDTFVTRLYGRAPDLIVEVLDEQIAALTAPPIAPWRIIGYLARHAPNFVAAAHERLVERFGPDDNQHPI